MSTSNPSSLILLRPEQVAEILGQKVETLAAWRRRGCSPPYTRISPIVVRYRRDLLEEWISDRTVSSTAEEFTRGSRIE